MPPILQKIIFISSLIYSFKIIIGWLIYITSDQFRLATSPIKAHPIRPLTLDEKETLSAYVRLRSRIRLVALILFSTLLLICGSLILLFSLPLVNSPLGWIHIYSVGLPVLFFFIAVILLLNIKSKLHKDLELPVFTITGIIFKREITRHGHNYSIGRYIFTAETIEKFVHKQIPLHEKNVEIEFSPNTKYVWAVRILQENSQG